MRNYLRILACVPIVLVASFIGANYLIDPYAVSGFPLPHGWNAIKPTFGDHHVLGKPFVVARRKPMAVVFGTSRENHGIDPEYAAWPTPAGSRFNMAMDAANIADVERLFEHVIAVGDLKEAVIALDFLNMFDANTHGAVDFDTQLLVSPQHPRALAMLNTLRYFASWAMFRDAVETLRHQDPALVEFEPTGRRNSLVFENAAKRFGQRHMFLFSETRYFRARLNLPRERRYSFGDPQGKSTLQPLANILDRAAGRGINVRLFVAPVHARQLEVYRRLGLWDALERWKRAVASVAEGSDLRDTPGRFALWDFSDYSELTTEAVPERGDLTRRMRFYWESSHYTKALGDLVLDRIFGRANPDLPKDFGVVLDSATLEHHLAQIRNRGRRYRNSHPHDIEELTRTADDVAASGVVLPM
jgi:hypothetical protein